MELRKLKFSEFIKTASHSSARSNNETGRSKQDSTDSPSRTSEAPTTFRLSNDFYNGLQINLGYLIRDTLNLDPQKSLEQNQNEIRAIDIDMSNVNHDNSEPQTDVVGQANPQDNTDCCLCHCIIS